MICEYTTTFPPTYSSFSHPINPSHTQRRQASTAACPATARPLIRVQALRWSFLFQIRQNINLDPSFVGSFGSLGSFLLDPSFLRCSSYYLPIPGRHLGHILMRNSVQDPQTPFSNQKLFSFPSSFSPGHLSFWTLHLW